MPVSKQVIGCLFVECTIWTMSDLDDAALILKTSVEQAFVPFHKLLDQLLGPAASVVGDSLSDQAEVWKVKRRIRFMGEVKRLADESGLNVNSIAPRLFFPVYEAASIEDDDDMQTRWAALIANEATKVGSVHPSFIEILRQMAPVDARLLDKLYDYCMKNLTRTVTPWAQRSITQYEIDQRVQAGENPYIPFNNLVRLGLIESAYTIDQKKVKIRLTQGKTSKFEGKLDSHYELADIAYIFVAACRAPKDKETKKTPRRQ